MAGEIRDVFARPQPGQGDRPAAAVPFLDVPAVHRDLVVAAFLLGVIARDTLGDPDAAGYAPRPAADLASPPGQPAHHFEALSRSEIRVLCYLQTNLSAQEIADELCVSVNTVKTHQRHLYQKLGARSRSQAVKQARAFGLLTPPAVAGHSPRVAADRRNHQNRGMPAHPPRPDAGRYGRPSAPSRQDRPGQH